MNFRIVEGGLDREENYSLFVEEYNKGTLVKDIMLKLDLNTKRYSDYYHRALEQDDIVSRRLVRSLTSKYYYRTHYGGFMVCKRNGLGVQEYYGVYKSVDEAEKIVALLMENDWDRNVIYEFKESEEE